MLTESEIRKEIENAEYLYKLRRDSKHYHEGYYICGYILALQVVLQEKNSNIIDTIKEKTDYDNLVKIMESRNKQV